MLIYVSVLLVICFVNLLQQIQLQERFKNLKCKIQNPSHLTLTYHTLKTSNHFYSIIFTLIIHMFTYYSFHVQNNGHPYEGDQLPISTTHLEIHKYNKNQIQNMSAQIELQRPSLYKVHSKPNINNGYTKKSKNSKSKQNKNIKNGCKSQANKFQKFQQQKIVKLLKSKDRNKLRLKGEQELVINKCNIKQKQKKLLKNQKSLNQIREFTSETNIKALNIKSKSSKYLRENHHNNFAAQTKYHKLSTTKSKQSITNANDMIKNANMANLKKHQLRQQKSLRVIQVQQNNQITQLLKKQKLKQLQRNQQLKGLQGKQLLRLKKIHEIERNSIQNQIQLLIKMNQQLSKAKNELSMNQI